MQVEKELCDVSDTANKQPEHHQVEDEEEDLYRSTKF